MSKIDAVESSYVLAKKLSREYWPKPELNESANQEQGNKAVDQMTVGEIALFFKYNHAGPTYCMVKQRIQSYKSIFEQFFDTSNVERHVVEKKVLAIISDLVDEHIERKE